MKRLYARPCKQDTDYARFVRYYLAHSHQFDERYSLHESLAHLTISLAESRLLLFNDEDGDMQGYIQYRFENETAFIHSTILSPAYRSGIAFYKGFVEWARYIMEEQIGIRQVRFHVRADHAYLNRLYAKFAKRIQEQKNQGAELFVYETAFEALLQYLRVDLSDKARVY